MIPKLLILSIMTAMLAGSCKKLADDDISPKTNKLVDTIPDGAYFKLCLLKDSGRVDETALLFNHAASPDFDVNLDAAYLPGFGIASLASLTEDNRACAIQVLPYRRGEPINLELDSRNGNNYTLQISAEKNLPSSTRIWIKENRLGDSFERRYGNYAFSVLKSDTSSCGNRRFVVILR